MTFEVCQNENLAPAPAPEWECGETLYRFLQDKNDIIVDGFEKFGLNPGSIKVEDLKAKIGKDGISRSLSTYRVLTDKTELVQRAERQTIEASWVQDPVAAVSSVIALKNIFEVDGATRAVCVYAEPLDGQGDPIGPSPTHCAIVQSRPDPPPKERIAIRILRSKIAAAFDQIIRLRDGRSYETL